MLIIYKMFKGDIIMENYLKEIIKRDERLEYNLELKNGLWEFVLVVKGYWDKEDEKDIIPKEDPNLVRKI